MKRFLLFLPFLFISCATTKQFNEIETKVYNSEDETIEYTITGKTITSTSELDGKQVLYHTVTLPASSIWFTIRETGKVIGYSFVNIFAGMFVAAGGEYTPISPDINKQEIELNNIQNEIQSTKYYKYKKYIKPMSSADIEEKKYTEHVDFNGNTKEISSEIVTKTYVEEDINKDLKKHSKKASIIGSKIGNAISYVLMFPSYFLGSIIFNF